MRLSSSFSRSNSFRRRRSAAVKAARSVAFFRLDAPIPRNTEGVLHFRGDQIDRPLQRGRAVIADHSDSALACLRRKPTRASSHARHLLKDGHADKPGTAWYRPLIGEIKSAENAQLRRLDTVCGVQSSSMVSIAVCVRRLRSAVLDPPSTWISARRQGGGTGVAMSCSGARKRRRLRTEGILCNTRLNSISSTRRSRTFIPA